MSQTSCKEFYNKSFYSILFKFYFKNKILEMSKPNECNLIIL